MRNRTRRMKQDVTYWGRPSDDGLGGKTFPSPVLLKCRWQQKAELFRDAAWHTNDDPLKFSKQLGGDLYGLPYSLNKLSYQ